MDNKRGDFAVPIVCPGCGQVGSIAWQENTGFNPGGPMRTLVHISSGFHQIKGSTNSGDPVIVCSNCGAVQTD